MGSQRAPSIGSSLPNHLAQLCSGTHMEKTSPQGMLVSGGPSVTRWVLSQSMFLLRT